MQFAIKLFFLVLLFATGPAVYAAGLNDTGQAACYDSAGSAIGCTGTGQDASYGRDAAVAAGGQLTKTGAGAAGFDFTKIANNGTALAAGALLGSGPTD